MAGRAGKFEFTFPFVPPWEDLRMELTASNGAKVYIFDSCVDKTKEGQEAIKAEINEIVVQAERRRFMQQMVDADACCSQIGQEVRARNKDL